MLLRKKEKQQDYSTLGCFLSLFASIILRIWSMKKKKKERIHNPMVWCRYIECTLRNVFLFE